MYNNRKEYLKAENQRINKETIESKLLTKFYEGNIEYEMSKAMAGQILATRKGSEQTCNPQDFLCKVVNEEFGVKGYCTRVLVI